MDWPIRTLTKDQAELLHEWNAHILKGHHIGYFYKVLYTTSDDVAANFNYNNILAFLDETTYYALSASIQQIETALDDIMHDIESIRKKSSI